MLSLLPLFPLDVVLLPGAPLPLHIFEPRYKEMIRECLQQKAPFGVVRTKEGGVAEVGCTAEITGVIKTYDDGRMDIVTEGRHPFEIMQVNHERSFLRAEVQFMEDEPGTSSSEQIRRALELHVQLMAVLGHESAPPPADAPQLSYLLAGSLPIDLDFKQTLLGIRSEKERLDGLIEFFEALVPQLKKAARRREKAGGNGHVP